MLCLHFLRGLHKYIMKFEFSLPFACESRRWVGQHLHYEITASHIGKAPVRSTKKSATYHCFLMAVGQTTPCVPTCSFCYLVFAHFLNIYFCYFFCSPCRWVPPKGCFWCQCCRETQSQDSWPLAKPWPSTWAYCPTYSGQLPTTSTSTITTTTMPITTPCLATLREAATTVVAMLATP